MMEKSSTDVENRPAQTVALQGELKTAPPPARFTVGKTAYIQNLTAKERKAGHYAVEYSASPNSFIVPALIVTDYFNDQKALAEKVARILEKHWDDDLTGASQ